MINVLKLRNKQVTVMGLGLHGGGLGVVNWLLEKGAKLVVTDLRDKKTLLPTLNKLRKKNITFSLGKHRFEDFQKKDLIIKNPGVARHSKFLNEARKNSIPIETDLSLFFRLCEAPIIGVTGTKGKSTTASLIFHIFKRAKRKPVMGGNIRISPLQFLPKITSHTPAILELSSWQLEDMEHLRVSPHLAVLTNVLPDHLNRYDNMQDYTNSKKLIFTWQNRHDFAILNFDNDISRSIGKEIKSKLYWFSTKRFTGKNGCFVDHGNIIFKKHGKDEKICQVVDIKLPGQHNIEHALAAVIVAKIHNISNQLIRSAIRSFKGIPDRLELIRSFHGRKFINDTTATSPDAAVAAMRCFSKNSIILLAGGFDKNLYYKDFVHEIKKRVAFLILFPGTATKKIIKELKKIIFSNFIVINSMAEAVRHACQHSKKEYIILLSPGAASFGMFLNEFDRGDKFKKEVAKLKINDCTDS